jgi:DNA polymerase delta subunit 3
MLYEFHTKHNAKKPKAVHATYILTGKKSISNQNGVNVRDGDDVVMRSSPPMSSMPDTAEPAEPVEEPVTKTSIVLVREEELESRHIRGQFRMRCAKNLVAETKSEFEDITSIHIYSLEPGPIEVRRRHSVQRGIETEAGRT